MPIDFFARRSHYVDHMLPVWEALDPSLRGCFYQPDYRGTPKGNNPMLVCAYGDLSVARQANPRRKFAFIEHGVGITYGPHPAYAGGIGLRSRVSLFLAPNEIVRAKTEKTYPGARQVVVGTPKLDKWKVGSGQWIVDGQKPVVAISFHWDGKGVQPEAGNAFEHFKRVLPQLARCNSFTLIGHGHPRAIEQFIPLYNSLGIPVVRNFDEVMQKADLYVCDNSSTIYEFCLTGKPVVLLNSPLYRKRVHWGIRFWDYTDVGLMVDRPEDLNIAILSSLANPGERKEQRKKAIADLYPYIGESAERAADAIRKWLSDN